MTTPTTADFVGLADTIYKRTDLTQGSFLQINNARYEVLDVINNSSLDGYYGAVLLDRDTKAVFVVNRGTQELEDWGIDAAMADQNVNLQWSDAFNLAQQAADYAAANGITNIYAIGHSPDGTKNTAFVGIALQRHEVSTYVPAHVEVTQWNSPNL